MSATVHIELPSNLCRLANCPHMLDLDVTSPVTLQTVLDALEARYPMLAGCIRDHATSKRRPFIRFFACNEDLSHLQPGDPLPHPVAEGIEPLLIIGAIAGG